MNESDLLDEVTRRLQTITRSENPDDAVRALLAFIEENREPPEEKADTTLGSGE